METLFTNALRDSINDSQSAFQKFAESFVDWCRAISECQSITDVEKRINPNNVCRFCISVDDTLYRRYDKTQSSKFLDNNGYVLFRYVTIEGKSVKQKARMIYRMFKRRDLLKLDWSGYYVT